VSPNSSSTLSSFASEDLYVDTAGCILQEDVRTKVKTPGTGENVSRRDCANSCHGEAVQTP
jgi:hypothetical protein